MAQHVLFTDFVKNAGKIPPPGGIISTALKAIALISHAGSMEFFRTSTGPDGTPWPEIRPRPDGSSEPLQDTGRLRNSVKAVIQGGNVVLQASHPGAAVHQFGATIKPVVAKYLSIPLTKEAKRVTGPRRMRGLFFLKTARGMWLASHSSTDGGLVFHWRLVDQVTIPARPYLGFSEQTLKTIENLLADSYERALILPLAGIRV